MAHDYIHLAAVITDLVMDGKVTWSELFYKHDFFHRYEQYLQVTAATRDIFWQREWYVASLVDMPHRVQVLNLSSDTGRGL